LERLFYLILGGNFNMTNPNYYAIIPANVRYDKDLSPNAKLLYGEITALSNAEGFCWANNAYFSGLYDVTKRSIQSWLSQLEAKGFIRVSLDSEGPNDSIRKIYIISPHEEKCTPPRKNLHGGHEENFTPPHEENFTHNNTSINNTNNNTKNKKNNSSNSPQIESEFEQLWKIYPRKMGKKKAFDSFKKARKVKKIPYETIENGLYRYIRYLEQQETDESFIMHGSTWFNQEKWQDEYITTGINKKPKNAMEYFRMKHGGDIYEPDGNGKVIDYNPEVIPEFF
jgi:DNA-binding PadR family transcriptional regulator